MGIRRALGLTASAPAVSPASLPPHEVGLLSPWQEGNLSPIVWSDVFGVEVSPVTRAEAMTVPAIVKARQVIVGQLAGLPLVALDATGPLADQPSWCQRTDGPVSPWHRLAWTYDDLLFWGMSVWRADALAADGRPLDLYRVERAAWTINADNVIVWADGMPAEGTPIDQAILITGPYEGLLTTAARTIRAARNLENSWAGRVRNPIPAMELHQVTDDILEDDEITTLLSAWSRARQDVNGALAYTPNSIEVRVHGDSSPDLYVEGRNAIRLDIANHVGLPAAALDGALSTASLTYVTQEGKFSELAEGLRLWADPVQYRLSQDDIVPRGTRVRFDTGDRTALAPSPTGPTLED